MLEMAQSDSLCLYATKYAAVFVKHSTLEPVSVWLWFQAFNCKRTAKAVKTELKLCVFTQNRCHINRA